METKKIGDLVVVSIMTRLDTGTAAEAEQTFRALLAAGEKKILCDFSATTYVASAGMRVLLMTAKALSRSGGKIAFCSLQPTVKKVFEIAGFTQIFPIYATYTEALSRMS